MKHLAEELAAWAEQHYGGLTVDSLLDRFRHNVLADSFSSEHAVAERAEGAIARAEAALPLWFTTLPRAEVVVRPIPDEMGLYSSEQDRAGMLVKHMWATSRLLVD